MKKVISIVILAIMVLFAAACGEKYDAEDKNVNGDSIVSSEEEHWDVTPSVMVNGQLYCTTGKESTIEARCGVMDGEITSTVEGWEIPTEDNQSNFGTGYGYQYVSEDTIEIYMNDTWWVYEIRE